MSAWYMLMDPRFGVYSAPKAPVAIRGSLGSAAGKLPLAARIRSLVSAISIALTAAIAKHRATRELEALDERLLRDIGISRGDIPTVVERAVAEMASGARRRQRPGLDPQRPREHDHSLAA